VEQEVKFTIPQINQLLSYCNMMEIEGYYFGSKSQWDARHEKIKQALQSELDKCNAKESANEHRKVTQD
jgi:hypothetical protein